MTVPMTPFLKTTLRLDAVISGAAALLMVAGAPNAWAIPRLAGPAAVLGGSDAVPFVALLAVLAGRENASRVVLFDIVLLNVA